MDKRSIVNRIIVALVTAIVVSAIVAHAGIPFVAITSGIAASMTLSFGWLKVTSLKEFVIDFISAIIGSQTGWVSLLI